MATKPKLTKTDRAFSREMVSQGYSYSEYRKRIQMVGDKRPVRESTYNQTERVVFNNLNSAKKWLNHPLRALLEKGWLSGKVWPRGKVCNEAIRAYDRGELDSAGVIARFGWDR